MISPSFSREREIHFFSREEAQFSGRLEDHVVKLLTDEDFFFADVNLVPPCLHSSREQGRRIRCLLAGEIDSLSLTSAAAAASYEMLARPHPVSGSFQAALLTNFWVVLRLVHAGLVHVCNCFPLADL